MQNSSENSKGIDPLLTDDLAQFLESLPDLELNNLANLMVRLSSSSGCVLPDAMKRDGLSGKTLIAPILYDIRYLAKYTIDKPSTYRQILIAVARRHAIKEIETASLSEIERRIQLCYPNALRPSPEDFKDRGSNELLRTLGYLVPPFGPISYLMSPDWRTVTAIILEIAALRRMSIIRRFASSLEL